MEVHVARQPIFDAEKQVIGYELLFRNGEDDFFPGMDADQATADVINSSFFLKVVDDLTVGKKAFINFSPRFLRHEMMTMLPPQTLAVEISENGEVDAAAVAACKHLKEQGYWVVVDDFVFRQQSETLVQVADMVKVDFLKTKDPERRNIALKLAGTKVALLAEKIETYYDFKQAKELGYRFFQGYFFGRPEVFSGRDIPGYTVNYLNMLREASRVDVDFDKLEQILRRDVALSFKMLKFINSAFFGLRNKVSSVKQALVLLGRKEILKWISLLALQNMAQDKPDELVVLSLSRARFGELLAFQLGWTKKSDQSFLVGLFSLVDAMLDRPMIDILRELPLDDEIVTALLTGDNDLGRLHTMARHYEKAEWADFSRAAKLLGIDDKDVAELYRQSVNWAQGLFALLG
ncbi:MAG: HDOD domain-containing protein [Veillonellaceae bacterium]|nr:HDOD domain-containing protein [Veillonellaceae bacterium]